MKAENVPFRSSIYTKTFVLNLLLVLLALGTCLFAAEAILPSITKEKSKAMTDATVNRLHLQITSIAQDLDRLSHGIQMNPIFLSTPVSEIQHEIKKIVDYSPLIDDVIVLNPEGVIVSGYPDPNGALQGKDFSEREYITETMNSKAIYYSDVFTAETGQPVIVIGIPLLSEQQEILKIVVLRIRLAENQMIDSLFQHFDIGSDGYMYLLDQNGTIFYHPDKKRIGEDATRNPVVQELIQGRSGYQEVINTNGVPMYASYRHIPPLGWGVVAQIPVESTLYPLQMLREKVWDYQFILIFPTALLLIMYTRRMTRPFQKLYEAIHEVANGNYEHTIQTRDQSEIGIISKRFNEMIEFLRMNREKLIEHQFYLRKIMDTDPNYIYARDRHGVYTLVNKARANYFGKTMDEMIGKNEMEINPFVNQAVDSLRTDKHVFETKEELFIPEYAILDHFGQTHYIQIHKMPIFNANHEVDQVLCVANDITELKQKENEIKYRAYHDFLTDLPNRVYFEEQVKNTILTAKTDKKMALIFLDLDHFKHINDSLGHAVGDQLLKKVSERLCRFIVNPNILARMGGDEFTILLPDIVSPIQIEKYANLIIESFKEPFLVDQREFHITSSIGISFYPKDGTDMDVLLKNADLAMYEAKKKGKNTFQFFDDQMSKNMWERLSIEAFMRRALVQDEFFVVYQPKFDIQQNKITGVEALLRWDCPHLGMVPPDQFIPIAEDSGLILPLGAWILKEACIQNKKWQEEGFSPIRMAVNISARQLMDPEFLNVLEETLQESGLDPQWLELEITESTLIQCSEGILTILHRLKEKKIHLSIDDFGTGYSSLSYLKQFPVQSLKIDRSFIRELDENNQSIIRAVMALSKSLKLSVTAEGVEEIHQMDFLRKENCDEIQGYLISKPVKATEFRELLINDHRKIPS